MNLIALCDNDEMDLQFLAALVRKYLAVHPELGGELRAFGSSAALKETLDAGADYCLFLIPSAAARPSKASASAAPLRKLSLRSRTIRISRGRTNTARSRPSGSGYISAAEEVPPYTVSGVETLGGKDVAGMNAGDWDLTLFTCTYGGAGRVVVRCRLAA